MIIEAINLIAKMPFPISVSVFLAKPEMVTRHSTLYAIMKFIFLVYEEINVDITLIYNL